VPVLFFGVLTPALVAGVQENWDRVREGIGYRRVELNVAVKSAAIPWTLIELRAR
jgi:hypothetical protein